MQKKILLEIACFTPESAISAYNGGADRVELCSGYSEGGLSPSAAVINTLKKMIPIDINVMVRPRVGDFVYSDLEKEIILRDIEYCKSTGVNGIVTGALTNDGKIDEEFLKTLIDWAKPMSVTFHRAFDLCNDLQGALKTLIKHKVDRVLTSGGKQNAIEGSSVIAKLVALAKQKIIILPGGGLNRGNIEFFIKDTRVTEVHCSAKRLKQSAFKGNKDVELSSTSGVSDNLWYESETSEISSMREKLSDICIAL